MMLRISVVLGKGARFKERFRDSLSCFGQNKQQLSPSCLWQSFWMASLINLGGIDADGVTFF